MIQCIGEWTIDQDTELSLDSSLHRNLVDKICSSPVQPATVMSAASKRAVLSDQRILIE